MEAATFTHSRVQRIGALLSVVVMLAFFAALTALGILAFTSSLVGGEVVPLEDRLVHLAGLGVMIWMVAWLSQYFRCQHAYRTTYVVDSQGVQIRADGETAYLRWHEFDVAEHFRMFFFMRLKSAKLEEPVILLLTTESAEATERSEYAQRLVEERMGARLKRRWW